MERPLDPTIQGLANFAVDGINAAATAAGKPTGWTWEKVRRVDAVFRRLQSINETRAEVVAGNAIPKHLTNYYEALEIPAATYGEIQALLIADIDHLRGELHALLVAQGAEVEWHEMRVQAKEGVG